MKKIFKKHFTYNNFSKITNLKTKQKSIDKKLSVFISEIIKS